MDFIVSPRIPRTLSICRFDSRLHAQTVSPFGSFAYGKISFALRLNSKFLYSYARLLISFIFRWNTSIMPLFFVYRHILIIGVNHSLIVSASFSNSIVALYFICFIIPFSSLMLSLHCFLFHFTSSCAFLQFKRSLFRCTGSAVSSQTAHKVSASQFNKGRSFLHAIFEFAIRREWCDKNPIKLIERKKVVEKEIIPLKLSETKRLIKTARNESPKYAMVAALLVYAGIRPREVRKLSWRDIDTEENTITVRSQCSKTGGVRHVEISPVLNSLLIVNKSETHSSVCPADWQRRWRKIRDNSGFKGHWVQDVLRHTYASYFTKRYSDLPRLQLNMGHRDLSLLRSRYVNMQNISKADAKEFFGGFYA